MNSDEEDTGRMKKRIGKKKKIALYGDEEDTSKKKKKSVKKMTVAVDIDEEDAPKKTKSGKKKKDAEPTRRSHRQAEKRTKKSG